MVIGGVEHLEFIVSMDYQYVKHIGFAALTTQYYDKPTTFKAWFDWSKTVEGFDFWAYQKFEDNENRALGDFITQIYYIIWVREINRRLRMDGKV